MNLDPYAPPASSLPEAAGTNSPSPPERQFYVVAPIKLLVLFVATLGGYSLYWFYRHWKQFKAKVGSDIWPIPRGFFNIFFTHSLFRFVEERIVEKRLNYVWDPGSVATQWVIFSIGCRGCGRLANRGVGSPVTDILSFLMLLAMAWTLYRAQQAINVAEGDSAGASNRRFSAANYAWTLLGALFWLLALIGMLRPEEAFEP